MFNHKFLINRHYSFFPTAAVEHQIKQISKSEGVPCGGWYQTAAITK